MSFSKEEIICWQCSEHNLNFPYVLNTINELKKKRISTNFKNIEDKINEDEDFNISSECIEALLGYMR